MDFESMIDESCIDLERNIDMIPRIALIRPNALFRDMDMPGLPSHLLDWVATLTAHQ